MSSETTEPRRAGLEPTARAIHEPLPGSQNVQGGNDVLCETQMFFNVAALLDDIDR